MYGKKNTVKPNNKIFKKGKLMNANNQDNNIDINKQTHQNQNLNIYQIQATQEDMQTISMLFGGSIQAISDDPSAPVEVKLQNNINGLFTSSEGMFRVCEILNSVLKHTPNTNIIVQSISSMAVVLAHIANKLAYDENYNTQNEYKIPEIELEPLMNIINLVNINLPDELK